MASYQDPSDVRRALSSHARNAAKLTGVTAGDLVNRGLGHFTRTGPSTPSSCEIMTRAHVELVH